MRPIPCNDTETFDWYQVVIASVVTLVLLIITFLIYNESYPYIKAYNWKKHTATITNIISRKEFKKYHTRHDKSKEPDTVRYKFIYKYIIDNAEYTGKNKTDIPFWDEKWQLDSIKRYEEFLRNIEVTSSKNPKSYKINESYINELKNYIDDYNNVIIHEGKKIDILVNPKNPKMSTLFASKESVRKLIIILVFYHYYLINTILIIYFKLYPKKLSCKINPIDIQNTLSLKYLPLELANIKYWKPLKFSCALIKQGIKKDKKNNILTMSFTNIASFKVLLLTIIIFAIGMKLNDKIYIDSDVPLITTIFTAIMIIYIATSNYLKSVLDKEKNEYYIFTRDSAKEKFHKELITPLKYIRAIQVITNYAFGKIFNGYQINIIYYKSFNQYDRQFVLSHRDLKYITKSAKTLSKFLNVPVIFDRLDLTLKKKLKNE